jgi:hypothetical protein
MRNSWIFPQKNASSEIQLDGDTERLESAKELWKYKRARKMCINVISASLLCEI